MAELCSTRSLFQSTPSVGRATIFSDFSGHHTNDFNPRPPWGGRRLCQRGQANRLYFNPRPPWGGRPRTPEKNSGFPLFQSTPSVGRATALQIAAAFGIKPFQSTPSVGRATTEWSFRDGREALFQSTPSVGRATATAKPTSSR